MGVFQRKTPNKQGKRPFYCDYVDATGEKRRYTPKTGLRRDAENFERKVLREIEEGCHVPKSQTDTIAGAVDTWLRDCEKRAKVGDRMTKSTVAMYEGCAKRIVPRLGSIKLTELTGPKLQAFADDLAEDLAAVTIGHTFMALGLVYDHAISIKRVLRNPVRDNKTRLPRKSGRIVVPPREALHKLIEAVRERLTGETHRGHAVRRAALFIGLFGGLRRGEVCGLKWDCVDLDRGVIHVRRSLSRLDGLKEPKSKAGVRDVPIVPQIREALEALASERDPSAFVLTTTRHGTPIAPNDLTNLHWRRVCKTAGLAEENGRPHYRLHSLRHAAVGLFIGQGLSPMHIKSVIGHAKVQTTLDIYGHLFPDDATIGNAARDIAAQFSAT